MDRLRGPDWKARAYRAEMVVAECRGLLADLQTQGTSYGAANRLRVMLEYYDLTD